MPCELERQGQADSRAERGNNINYTSTKKPQMVAHSLILSKADVMSLRLCRIEYEVRPFI